MNLFRRSFDRRNALALLVLTSAACSHQPAQDSKQAAQAKPEVSTSSACAADASWIQNPSQPNFGADPNSVCAFHQYAWHSFLFLTSASPAGGFNFENYRSVSDVFSNRHGTFSRCWIHGTSGTGSFCPASESRHTKELPEGQAKAIASGEAFNEDQQAGSGGVLISQSNQIIYDEQPA